MWIVREKRKGGNRRGRKGKREGRKRVTLNCSPNIGHVGKRQMYTPHPMFPMGGRETEMCEKGRNGRGNTSDAHWL